MLSIELRPGSGLEDKLNSYPDRIREKWEEKLNLWAELLYKKVIENLTGKVLQTKSGELVESIDKEVHTSGYDFIAFVGPVPATAKAYALEYGGKGSYPIVPVAKTVLSWYDDYYGHVFAKQVLHPPSKEYAYLRRALEELRADLPSEFTIT